MQTTPSHGLSVGTVAGLVVAVIAGLTILAIVAILFLRRRKRRFVPPHEDVRPFLASPQMFVDMSSLGTRSGSVVGAGVKGGLHVREDNTRRSNDAGRLGKPPVDSDATSSPDSESTSSPVPSVSAPDTVNEDQLTPLFGPLPGQAPVDMGRQLFEDRKFESELLDFLSTRMDPPQAAAASHGPLRLGHLGGGDEPPDYYREE